MSTDLQDLSIDIQKAAIRSHAARHGFEIAKSYVDEGRSGLSLHRRTEMKRLLTDVEGPECPFSVILVYDVSRWGRFQDTDAAAYYEYHCRLHGIEVIYVQEPFGLERSPMTALVKSLKRAMAAEFSRELAVKTIAGQHLAIQRGFQIGPAPCLAIRRVAVAPDGSERPLLRLDRKSRQSERIRWVTGPDHEVQTVRSIFERYAYSEVSMQDLAAQLEAEGARAASGGVITVKMLATLLSCETFIGNFVWGRVDHTMRRRGRVRKDGDRGLVRARGSLPAIIDNETWEWVQAKRFRRGTYRTSRSELLSRLRAALERNPALTSVELKAYGCPGYKAYASKFGSFREAVRLTGVDVSSADASNRKRQGCTHRHSTTIVNDICKLLESERIPCSRVPRHQMVAIGESTRVRVHVVFKKPYQDTFRWWFVPRRAHLADWSLIVRMTGDQAGDFLLASLNQYLYLPKWLTDEVPAGLLQIRSASELVTTIRYLADRNAKRRVSFTSH